MSVLQAFFSCIFFHLVRIHNDLGGKTLRKDILTVIFLKCFFQFEKKCYKDKTTKGVIKLHFLESTCEEVVLRHYIAPKYNKLPSPQSKAETLLVWMGKKRHNVGFVPTKNRWGSPEMSAGADGVHGKVQKTTARHLWDAGMVTGLQNLQPGIMMITDQQIRTYEPLFAVRNGVFSCLFGVILGAIGAVSLWPRPQSPSQVHGETQDILLAEKNGLLGWRAGDAERN